MGRHCGCRHAHDRGLNTFMIIAQTEDGEELSRSNVLRLRDFDMKSGAAKLTRILHQVGALGQDVTDKRKRKIGS